MPNSTLRIDKNALKKIHQFTNATATEMKAILKEAGNLMDALSQPCDAIHDACDVCASTGRPAHRKNVSLTQVSEAFNESVQADFLVVYIENVKYEVINIIDAGKNYGERSTVTKQDASDLCNKLESEWMYIHGAPKFFSADTEFTKPVLKKLMRSHAIQMEDRPARCSSKNGKIERNNDLFKSIFAGVSKETPIASTRTIVARMSFLCTLFHVNSTLSSFQLARGYSTSLLGIPATRVPEEILHAHKRTTATRALQKLLKAQNNHLVPPHFVRPGTSIWVCYNTSKQNHPISHGHGGYRILR
ncbi:hypothetical protein BWQ96_10281 [Gracilariopsis chorda]|uniref:Integrase catalytic domain-containing protein n=1 Tax=Gracilariopsis chorda TaxID=448386 RepID=A0A2V3ID40_9FLOR|nr:hypothetical protein BWQ96_10281 [Gracilariopsis chorda]|eukprot:PXF40003.1 hypothetical protein BWQ96_10281 [Gracilariopsis chorda]